MEEKIYLDEQDIVNFMVDFLRDEHQFMFAAIYKKALINKVLEIVEIENEETLKDISDAAQGVLEALTEAGYLRKKEEHYEIYKYLDDDANVVIEYEDDLEENEENEK